MESTSSTISQANNSPTRLQSSRDTTNNCNFLLSPVPANETAPLTSKQSNSTNISNSADVTTKRCHKIINRRFNSISEQSIDSTEYGDPQASTPALLNSKNFWRSQTGIKKRLSLKLIKKRDSYISKLEEDQKFLNK